MTAIEECHNDDNDDSSSTTTTTRVCVKNVPLGFSEEKLIQHLTRNSEQHLDITDCRILKTKDGKSRKLAFVGFKTHQMASHVVTRYHKTYAQTSRLLVEPAFSKKNTKDPSFLLQHRPWSKHSVGSSLYEKKAHKQQQHEKERTTSHVEQTSTQQKHQHHEEESEQVVRRRKEEFLSAMMGSTMSSSQHKSKFWSNDDGVVLLPTTTTEEGQQQAQQPNNNNDNDYNSAMRNDDNDGRSSSSDSSLNNDDSSVDSGGQGADVMQGRSFQTATPVAAGSVLSDMEFLRTKAATKENLTDDEDHESEDDVDSDNDDGKDAKGTVPDDKKEDDQHSDSSSSVSSSSDDDYNDSEDESDDSENDANHETAVTTNNQQSSRHKEDDTHQDKVHEIGKSETGGSSKVAPNRLFVRNLPFASTEEELSEHFANFGTVLECHVPVDDQKRSKGFAFVTLDSNKSATWARNELDGIDFQGRLLHILPSRRCGGPTTTTVDDNSGGNNINDKNLTYKQKMELQRKHNASSSDNKGANTSFVRGDAVVDNLSDRLGLNKGDIFNVKDGLSSGDAAVRLALGETHIIEENREYFRNHGVNMDALVSVKVSLSHAGGGGAAADKKSPKRSSTSILVKNLPYETTTEEDLTKLFHGVGGGDVPNRILLPPSRTIALVEYGHATDARRAFRKLAYKRFKHVPLYLEWAPIGATTTATSETGSQQQQVVTNKKSQVGYQSPMEQDNARGDNDQDLLEEEEPTGEPGVSHTIYVKNLNFSTTEEQLHQVFEKHVKSVRAVKIPTKMAPIKKGETKATSSALLLSMGFGFVECDSDASVRKAIKALQGTVVDGHALEMKRSSKQVAVTNKRKQTTAPSSKTGGNKNPPKLMVRNVPFQATRKELLQLFGSFGQLKKVRLPKKFDGGHRGFAFVEFLTSQEAQTAMNTLSRTHLYGRHLVLEWADDKNDMDTLREKAQRDVLGLPEMMQGMPRKNKKIRFDF